MAAPLRSDLEDQLKMIRDSQQFAWLLRVNPLFAGCFLMDHQFKYLESGHKLISRSSRLRAFCHIYSAARDRRLLDAIPFVEELIQKHENLFFTPSRAAAAHGSFAKSYLTSQSHVSPSVNSAASKRRAILAPRDIIENMEMAKTSRLLRLLYLDDYSVLPAESTVTSSWKSLLQAVTDMCTNELFESRLLSRDLLKIHCDVTDLFFSLRDELCRRFQFESMVSDSRGPRDQAVNQALDNVVVFPLLPLLDSLNDDGTTRLTRQIAGLGRSRSERQRSAAFAESISGGLSNTVLGYCRHAAGIIARRFGNLSSTEIEKMYFTLPAELMWATLEFGVNISPIDETQPDVVEEFDSLMEMFEGSQGPLSRAQFDEFKRRVIARPGVLALTSTDPSVELCSLLHHAAAGPAHDRYLVEWLIQMGALDVESPHCRYPNAVAKARANGHDVDLYGNTLAVHSAAERRLTEIVKLLLDGAHLRDLDTTTYRTKDSLAHIAVRTDNVKLFRWLAGMDVDVSRKNAAGKRVWQLTSSPLFKKEILTIDTFQKQEADRVKAKNARGPMYRPGVGSEKLWESLANQQQKEQIPTKAENREISAAFDLPAHQPTSTCSKKKKNRKKKKKKVLNDLVEKVKTSNHSESTGEKVSRFAQTLERLYEGTDTPHFERETLANTAMNIISEFEQALDGTPTLRTMVPLSTIQREVLDAAQVVFLLDAFNSQLPIPRPTVDEISARPSNQMQLNAMAGPPDQTIFYSFFSFAFKVGIMLQYYGLQSRADELWRMLETRLLAIEQRGDKYTNLVQTYVDGRRKLDIQPIFGSTEGAQREFGRCIREYEAK